MKRLLLFGCLLAWGTGLFAGPAGVIFRGVAHAWDDIAKMALKVSGRSADDAAVKAASRSLKKTAETYGDDVARLAAEGGMEVAEGVGRHGMKMLKIMGQSQAVSRAALRQAALHTDDMIRLVPKYGDDIIRVNERLPGQGHRLVKAMKRAGVSEAKGIRVAAGVSSDSLGHMLTAVEKNPKVGDLVVRCTKAGGSEFVEKLIQTSPRLVLAGGLSTAAVMTAYRMTAASAASAEALTTEQDLAREIIRDPEAPAESKRWAESALGAQRLTAESQSLAGTVRHLFYWPILIVAVILSSGWVLIRCLKKRRSRGRRKSGK